MGEGVRAGQHVIAAHAGGHERLMRVAEGGVGDELTFLLPGPLGEFLRSEFQQQVARPLGYGFRVIELHRMRRLQWRFRLVSLGVRVAVHNHVAEVVQKPGRAIPTRLEGKQLGRGVDQRCRGLPVAELRVRDHVFNEGDVCLHAADAEFGQGPVHAIHRHLVGPAAGDGLDEPGIVEGRDHRADVGHAGVQPDAEAARGAVGKNPAVVRSEIVLRILRGDTALYRESILGNVRLRGQVQFRRIKRVSLRNQDLAAHDVDARDNLRDGVFDLHAGIHLDEIPLVGVEVVEELHRARVVVADLLCQTHRAVAQFRDHRLGQAEARGDLDDLLVPPLHGAVALMQMQDIALAIAKDLHLYVLHAGYVLLEEHGGIAERAPGLRLRLVQQTLQFGRLAHDAHPAPPAAKRRLDDQRKSDLLRGFQRLVAINNGLLGAGQGGHANALTDIPSGCLVAHHVEQFGARPDEGDAGRFAGSRKFRILTQKTIAWMDRVHSLLLGQCDDARDVQIRGDRSVAFADQIGLVSLEAMLAEAVFLREHGNRP